MKKSNIFITALALFFAVSCSGPEKKEAEQSSDGIVQEQTQQAAEDPQEEALTDLPEQASSQSSAGQNEAPPLLNPPHGQPYHRCDIPVGSPLPAGSPQESTTTAAATPASAPVDRSMIPTVENANRMGASAGSQATAATGTPPRLNPPHGQPFHRCDIPVGSPLPVN
ncbi:MAG: hypothetical protein V2I46_04390 [Bacteroides sp.]|jgi:hypothetical protein|nr:hypothetical protein [Bacteroides sp.]